MNYLELVKIKLFGEEIISKFIKFDGLDSMG
jgi:hypothetical protein